jgi:hypothetical protein
LRVKQRAEAVGDRFRLLKFGLIGLVRGIIYDSVAFVVEASRCLRRFCRKRVKGEGEHGNAKQDSHHVLPGWLLANVFRSGANAKWKFACFSVSAPEGKIR